MGEIRSVEYDRKKDKKLIIVGIRYQEKQRRDRIKQLRSRKEKRERKREFLSLCCVCQIGTFGQ